MVTYYSTPDPLQHTFLHNDSVCASTAEGEALRNWAETLIDEDTEDWSESPRKWPTESGVLIEAVDATCTILRTISEYE